MSCKTQRGQSPRISVLPTGQAQTFTPDSAGVLRIQSGRAWVTLSHPQQRLDSGARPAIAEEDVFLDSETRLPLCAGQSIVLESWPEAAATELTWVWEAVVPDSRSQRWQHTVVQPAHELAQGLAQAGLASAKMLQGLAGYTSLLLNTKEAP